MFPWLDSSDSPFRRYPLSKISDTGRPIPEPESNFYLCLLLKFMRLSLFGRLVRPFR
jgi:hypothetical protein